VFFIKEGFQRPLTGHGTGYSVTFDVGPHNIFLSMLNDTGIPGLALYTALLGSLGFAAFRRRSPLLAAVVGVALLNSMFSHHIFTAPPMFVLAGAALALARRKDGSLAPGQG
jgi:O-antigen ligase